MCCHWPEMVTAKGLCWDAWKGRSSDAGEMERSSSKTMEKVGIWDGVGGCGVGEKEKDIA